jgi:hypothetical protein
VRSPAATIEAFDYARAKGRSWLGRGALMLAVLALQPIVGAIAQQPTRDEALAERLRQIQGQLTAGTAEPTGAAVTPKQQSIEQFEAVQSDHASDASTGTGPTLGEDQVRSLVSEGLGVEVLNIEAIESEGRPAYAVTVMEPAGNVNGALAVETLLVDGATGGLLGGVPQAPRTAGATMAEAPGRAAPDSTGPEIRRRTHR